MARGVLYPRFLERRLLEALDDSPAVLVHGPRQCGKTTLARTAGKPRGYTYVTLDDDVVRGAAVADPLGFAADLPERVILDEVQRAPTLFPALKMEIDRRRAPGRFLLTGSTHVLLVPRLAESLAGRLQVLRLHPLAQCELERREPDFLDALFGGGFPPGQGERLGRGLARRVAAGGYPVALSRPAGRRRADWHLSYVETLVQRDVRDLARIDMLNALPRLLAVAATQTARLFNASDLAAPFQLSRPTIRDYVTLLERVFLLDRLPPWHSNRLRRLVKTPKLHVGDTGVACALLGADAAALAADRTLLGHLLETFVYQELRRQAGWYDAPLSFFHFRDKDGAEVDIVMERGAVAVAGVEVKRRPSRRRTSAACASWRTPPGRASRAASCYTTGRRPSASATGCMPCRSAACGSHRRPCRRDGQRRGPTRADPSGSGAPLAGASGGGSAGVRRARPRMTPGCGSRG